MGAESRPRSRQSQLANGAVKMPAPSGNVVRTSGSVCARPKWVSSKVGRGGCLVLLLTVVCLDGVHGISYRKDTGFLTDGKDQFVFRESQTNSAPGVVAPVHPHTATTVKRAGRVRFVDTSPSEQYPGTSSGAKPTYNRGTVESVPTSPFFGGSSSVSSSPTRERDQFYTVGASIQLAGGGGTGDTITPPPPPLPHEAIVPKPPKRKKNKFKYSPNANEKAYNTDVQDQSPFSPQVAFGGQRYPVQDNNYFTPAGRPVGGVYDNSLLNYPELQKQQYPFSMKSPYYQPGGYYGPGQQVPSPGGSPYPYQYQYPSPYSQQQYASGPPYQPGSSPAYYPSQQSASFGGNSAGPPNAQSILGVLQSIFNFAPGTFGSATVRPPSAGSLYAPAPSPFSGGFGGGGGGVGGQVRQALDNISENDELQCVPKLICMMSRSSTGQGFSLVNRGLLSTILGAVPDSSPWLKFSRAALLGYGIGANSCDAYYPKCPKDEMEILYYLNNHRGGFFRFFSNGEQQQQQQQQQPQQQYQQQQYYG